jgi:hypothetical protein
MVTLQLYNFEFQRFKNPKSQRGPSFVLLNSVGLFTKESFSQHFVGNLASTQTAL